MWKTCITGVFGTFHYQKYPRTLQSHLEYAELYRNRVSDVKAGSPTKKLL